MIAALGWDVATLQRQSGWSRLAVSKIISPLELDNTYKQCVCVQFTVQYRAAAFRLCRMSIRAQQHSWITWCFLVRCVNFLECLLLWWWSDFRAFFSQLSQEVVLLCNKFKAKMQRIPEPLSEICSSLNKVEYICMHNLFLQKWSLAFICAQPRKV